MTPALRSALAACGRECTAADVAAVELALARKHRNRNRDLGNSEAGRFAPTDHDALCVCGHELGVHASERYQGEQPCFAGDDAELAPDGCGCSSFRRSRKGARSMRAGMQSRCNPSKWHRAPFGGCCSLDELACFSSAANAQGPAFDADRLARLGSYAMSYAPLFSGEPSRVVDGGTVACEVQR